MPGDPLCQEIRYTRCLLLLCFRALHVCSIIESDLNGKYSVRGKCVYAHYIYGVHAICG